MTPAAQRKLKAAAEARANRDCSDALAAAIVAARRGPEFQVQGDAVGKRLLVPVGAIARGNAAHLAEAMTRAHPAIAAKPKRRR